MKKYIRRLKLYKKTFLFILSFLVSGVFLIRFFLPFIVFAKENSLTPSFLFNFIFKKKINLKSSQNKTNILILGTAGDHYAGSDLTDTMLFLSFDLEKNNLTTISIPRDIWSDTLQDKINSAYHYGKEKKQGGGLLLSKVIVEEVLNQPIHYSFLIDFKGFEKIINILGGIDVYIERDFDDYKFPIPNRENDLCNGDLDFSCRFEHISFKKGWQKMNGETALKFIRSRNAKNEEGTDFARNKRQQKILEAVKNKVLSFEILTKPNTIISLLRILQKNTKTNANLAETFYIAKLFLRKNKKQTISLEEKLITPSLWQYRGRWVLIPNKGWKDFHDFIKEKLLRK